MSLGWSSGCLGANRAAAIFIALTMLACIYVMVVSRFETDCLNIDTVAVTINPYGASYFDNPLAATLNTHG